MVPFRQNEYQLTEFRTNSLLPSCVTIRITNRDRMVISEGGMEKKDPKDRKVEEVIEVVNLRRQ